MSSYLYYPVGGGRRFSKSKPVVKYLGQNPVSFMCSNGTYPVILALKFMILFHIQCGCTSVHRATEWAPM